MGQQSLYTIMHWLINEFKYRCDHWESINDYKFSQNGVNLETTKDTNLTMEILNTNPVLKLNLVNQYPNLENFSEYVLDKKKFEESESSIMVNVKTITGKLLIINVNPTITKVFELKLKIQDMESVPPCQQRIIFSGRQLEDHFLLSDYGIEDKATFHLVLRLRGGMYNEVSGRNGQYEPLTNIFYDISHYRVNNNLIY